MALDKVVLPPLAFFEKPDLWLYGRDMGKWPELEAALGQFKDFHVVNARTQQHQAKISKLVDSSRDEEGWGLLHCLVAHRRDAINSSAAAQQQLLIVRRLLCMGSHPDLVTTESYLQWKPSHICTLLGSVEIAQVLVVCRPSNHRLKDVTGYTPAAWRRHPDVANIFEEAERNRFPTIAQLAKEQKWWAVQNLCRRGVVPETEKFALHDGKDAIGWAVQHKEFNVAQELEYLLKGVMVQPARHEQLEERLVAQKADLTKRDAEKEAMKQKLEEQAEHLAQLKLDQAMLKKEGDQLKEMLLLNLTKMSEDCQDLKKELMTALKEKHSKLKDDLQRRLDHQAEKLNQKMKMIDCTGVASRQKMPEIGQAAQAVSNSAAGEDEGEKIATLEAENKALREKVDQQQEVLKQAQGVLLSSSLMKADNM